MTGGKLSSILGANRDITHWSVRSSSKRGGDGVKMVDVEVILASYKFNFIRVHDNLV